MARPIRLEFSGAIYHVTARGDRREAIYEDDKDRQLFLDWLGVVVAEANWVCHARRAGVRSIFVAVLARLHGPARRARGQVLN